jgi:hypothetical protein
LKGRNGLRRSAQCDDGDECLFARRLRAIDENVTESKAAKAQSLAKMRDKKCVSLVSIGERLQSSSHEIEHFRKDRDEHSPKATHQLGEYIVTLPKQLVSPVLGAWLMSTGKSEGWSRQLLANNALN